MAPSSWLEVPKAPPSFSLTIVFCRFRPVRHPREPHRRVAHPPSWRLHRGVEQRRRGPVRLGVSPPEKENQENDLVVRGGERRV
jgi:hypothetical protein